jgi:rod shape determining protein RodA
MTLLATNRQSRRLGTMAIMLRGLHLDGMLVAGIIAILAIGLAALYSAVGQNSALVINQLVRILAAAAVMLFMAQVEPNFLRRASPFVYVFGLILLSLVLITGDVGKGAQRWLNIGLRFQPSEIMKLGFHERPLPPSFGMIIVAVLVTLVPVSLIVIQPDLGTAILIVLSGATVIFLAGIGVRYILGAILAGLIAGIGVRYILGAILAGLISMPILWYLVMLDYQKRRVLTLIDPDSDPLGSGYHIIQSKIAIGSGGLFGKGWLNGSQGQLEFLPERSTDFIFAIIGEELGLMGALSVLLVYLFIVGRGLVIAATAQDTFSRLLAGSISLTFFFYIFVNTAMVTGLVPVVGIPLPLVSAGGTSMVTLLAGFGILMSIQTHRKLLAR